MPFLNFLGIYVVLMIVTGLLFWRKRNGGTFSLFVVAAFLGGTLVLLKLFPTMTTGDWFLHVLYGLIAAVILVMGTAEANGRSFLVLSNVIGCFAIGALLYLSLSLLALLITIFF